MRSTLRVYVELLFKKIPELQQCVTQCMSFSVDDSTVPLSTHSKPPKVIAVHLFVIFVEKDS